MSLHNTSATGGTYVRFLSHCQCDSVTSFGEREDWLLSSRDAVPSDSLFTWSDHLKMSRHMGETLHERDADPG